MQYIKMNVFGNTLDDRAHTASHTHPVKSQILLL